MIQQAAVVEGAVVKTIALVGGLSFERGVPIEEAKEYLGDPNGALWMDVQDPGADELALLRELFDLHPLALENVAEGRLRPKVDEYQSNLFAVTYALLPETAGSIELRSVELDLFIGRNFLVTIHRGPLPVLDEAQQRWVRGKALIKDGIGFLLYALFDAVVDGYLPVVERIDQALDRAREAMLRESSSHHVSALLDLRRGILRLSRQLALLAESFVELTRRDRELFAPGIQIYFRDVHDQLLGVLDRIETQRDIAAAVLEASVTIASNRLNTTLRRLTAVAIAAGFAGAVFGAWGMNFSALPIADSPSGFLLVVGGTIGVLLALLALSRARDWL